MTFEDEQDFRILSLLMKYNDVILLNEFKDITSKEDNMYLIGMEKRGLLESGQYYFKDVTGEYEEHPNFGRCVTTLGKNKFESLISLKEEEIRKDKIAYNTYKFTKYATLLAALGVIVSIALYLLSQHK